MKIFFYFLPFLLFSACAPSLTIYQIEKKINNNYKAFVDQNIDHMVENTPKEYLEAYGKKEVKEKLTKIFKNKGESTKVYNKISSLHVRGRLKCNKYYFYTVSYKVKSTEYTPYIDSTALALNINNYGKKNVQLEGVRPNIFLTITKSEEEILIYDKDKKWKILHLNQEKSIDKYYNHLFSKCLKD